MASKKWDPLVARFRALLAVLRALVPVKDKLPEDSFDEAATALDEMTYTFPDEIYSDLTDEVSAVSEADAESVAGTGTVASLQTGMPLDVAVKTLTSQIETLNKQVDALAATDDGEDDEEGEGESAEGGSETSAPDEP